MIKFSTILSVFLAGVFAGAVFIYFVVKSMGPVMAYDGIVKAGVAKWKGPAEIEFCCKCGP